MPLTVYTLDELRAIVPGTAGATALRVALETNTFGPPELRSEAEAILAGSSSSVGELELLVESSTSRVVTIMEDRFKEVDSALSFIKHMMVAAKTVEEEPSIPGSVKKKFGPLMEIADRAYKMRLRVQQASRENRHQHTGTRFMGLANFLSLSAVYLEAGAVICNSDIFAKSSIEYAMKTFGRTSTVEVYIIARGFEYLGWPVSGWADVHPRPSVDKAFYDLIQKLPCHGFPTLLQGVTPGDRNCKKIISAARAWISLDLQTRPDACDFTYESVVPPRHPLPHPLHLTLSVTESELGGDEEDSLAGRTGESASGVEARGGGGGGGDGE